LERLLVIGGKGMINLELINLIDNPSEEAQLIAVKQDGNSIKYIDNPSEAVQIEAVKQNGYAIKFIDNPSEAVQLEADKQKGDKK
jgi:DNA-dependent RNA polymerase auxiliary subunit epsilon